MKGENNMGIFSIFKKKQKKESISKEEQKPSNLKETRVSTPKEENHGLGQPAIIAKPTTVTEQKPVIIPTSEPTKTTPKKQAPKPKGAVTSKSTEVKSKTETTKATTTKASKYHVSQNKDPKSDSYKKWRVRIEGSQKTIKFFDTQKEAIAHAEDLAKSAGSSVVVHKLDGTIRKQNY
jgi:uncharacterized protein YdaT